MRKVKKLLALVLAMLMIVSVFSVFQLTASAAASNGVWQKSSGNWYYVVNGTRLKNQWVNDGVGWCYLNQNGKMLSNQWIEDNNGWCYLGSNGYMLANQWFHDGTGWTYLQSNGYMKECCWFKDGSTWYYLGANGYILKQTNKTPTTDPGATDASLSIKDLFAWAYNDKTAKFRLDYSDITANVYTGDYKYLKANLQVRTYNSKTESWSSWQDTIGANTRVDLAHLYLDSKTAHQKYYNKYVGYYKTFNILDKDVMNGTTYFTIGKNITKIQFRINTWGFNGSKTDGPIGVSYNIIGYDSNKKKYIYDSKEAQTDGYGYMKVNYSNTVTYSCSWSGAKYKLKNGKMTKYYQLSLKNQATNATKKIDSN